MKRLRIPVAVTAALSFLLKAIWVCGGSAVGAVSMGWACAQELLQAGGHSSRARDRAGVGVGATELQETGARRNENKMQQL